MACQRSPEDAPSDDADCEERGEWESSVFPFGEEMPVDRHVDQSEKAGGKDDEESRSPGKSPGNKDDQLHVTPAESFFSEKFFSEKMEGGKEKARDGHGDKAANQRGEIECPERRPVMKKPIGRDQEHAGQRYGIGNDPEVAVGKRSGEEDAGHEEKQQKTGDGLIAVVDVQVDEGKNEAGNGFHDQVARRDPFSAFFA